MDAAQLDACSTANNGKFGEARPWMATACGSDASGSLTLSRSQGSFGDSAWRRTLPCFVLQASGCGHNVHALPRAAGQRAGHAVAGS
jgi:hypothetical protein